MTRSSEAEIANALDGHYYRLAMSGEIVDDGHRQIQPPRLRENRPWSNTERERLVTLYREGVSTTGIAEAMDRSRKGIWVQLKGLRAGGQIGRR